MTITEDERRRLLGEREDGTIPDQTFQRSGVVAALLGMLAGLGMLVLVTAILSAGALLLGLEFDLIGADAEELSIIGLAIASVAILISTVVGGFVAGRLARHGGIRTGVGSALWLSLVLAIVAGLTMLLGAVSVTFDGFDLADRLSRFDTTDLVMAALIAAGGLFVLALLGGLAGGRLGQTDQKATETVIDLRDDSVETEAAGETEQAEPEQVEEPTRLIQPEAEEPVSLDQQPSPDQGTGS